MSDVAFSIMLVGFCVLLALFLRTAERRMSALRARRATRRAGH
ncbi:MAG TPA: hypothetical protein VHW44_17160 [Pseudonocardiaceae bacterium]|jgi:hypothetical protein|nr:hypothetical protein [Pseudonocardiaceae bacterium]